MKVLKQECEQNVGGLTRGPHRPIELVLVGVVAPVAASHDAEDRGHGALARCQYGYGTQ